MGSGKSVTVCNKLIFVSFFLIFLILKTLKNHINLLRWVNKLRKPTGNIAHWQQSNEGIEIEKKNQENHQVKQYDRNGRFSGPLNLSQLTLQWKQNEKIHFNILKRC